MWMVLAVFAGVMAIVYGLYWLLVVRDEEQFLKRLRPTDGSPERRMRGFLKTEERLSSVGSLDDGFLVHSRGAQGAPLTQSPLPQVATPA